MERGQRDVLRRELQETLDRINGQMSNWRTDSLISRFNRDRTGGWFAVSDELVLVLDAARRINRQTGGAFDVTVGGLVNLWGFGASEASPGIPIRSAIDAALAHSGQAKLEVDTAGRAIRKIDPRLEIDLSGIAKGYGIDALANVLERSEVHDFIVEIGGEVRASGARPDGLPWRVAVERPGPGGRVLRGAIALDGAAIATSGDYREFFEINGRRYSHIIDPRTGSPPDNGVASASVVAGDALTADALATACMVMGKEKAMAMAERRGLAVMITERKRGGYSVFRSSAFDALQAIDPR
jgi:thiamine biosynthesis lipoprotein